MMFDFLKIFKNSNNHKDQGDGYAVHRRTQSG